MKLWKSPVLHFGILLVVALVALLAAPFLIDWNGYRKDLEAYGGKLTGRAVRIEGPVSARLFPWPRLTAEAVSIANPPGFSEPDFARAERITIRMTLAGLLQGAFNVESIDVEAPAINFERLASGDVNWRFAPSQDLLRSDLLSRVKLDKIALTGGAVSFRDQRRSDSFGLTGVTADVASPGIEGPWRLRARALHGDRPLDISVNTATYVAGEPFLFGVKLAASDGSGYGLNFDGGYATGAVTGELRLAPAAAEDGKTDAEGRIRPLVFSAKVAGDFDLLKLSDIRVAQLEQAEAGPLAAGTAELRLGQRIAATAELSAALLDLDELAGARSRSLLREAGNLAVANSLLAMLPAEVSIEAAIKVTALKAEGQTFDNVSLALEADRERLRINRFFAGLPGRTDMLFTGTYFPGADSGELAGDLALDAADLRDFVMWLWPKGRDTLAGLWTGSRGRLKMQTKLGMTSADVRLTGTQFELDGELGQGSLAVTAAGRGAVDLTLESGRFDFDSYAPQGVPAFSAAAREGVGALLALMLPHAEAPDLRLKLKAGEVLLNAVTARDVAVDLQSGANGLDLRALRIGAVGGASLEASGLILDNGKGADGSVSLDVKAEDPSELIKLLGLATGDSLPPWAASLGPMALRSDLGVSPAPQGSDVAVKIGGTAGKLTVSGTGRVGADMVMTGDLKLDSPGSAPILALFGQSLAEDDTLPSSLALSAAGRLTEGLEASGMLQALGARLDYQGRFNPAAEGYGLDGKLSLRSTDARPLAAWAGLPAPLAGAKVLVADTPLIWRDGKWDLQEIAGRFGPETFGGALSLTPERVIDGRFTSGPVMLRDLLAAAFLEWTGPEAGLETAFADGLPAGLSGRIWLTPAVLDLHPNLAVRNAEIGLEAEGNSIHLVIRGKDAGGRDAAIELRSTGEEASRNLEGSVRLPVDLAKELKLVNGTPVADGQGQIELRFTGAGRSPAAALAAASGEGSYSFTGFRLPSVTPEAFTEALTQARDAAGMTRAFDALRGGAGLDFGDVAGAITLKEGEAQFASLERKDANADVTLRTLADLAQGEIDIDIGLTFKVREGLPPMSIAYAGPPGALARSENNSELATALGVKIMQEGIVELERLQQEQARLAKLEEEQRLQDEARLQAYYAQRDELLLRRRELRVHGELQAMEADRLRRQIEAERAANAEINKTEIRQRQRELKTWRRLAQADAPSKPAAPAPQKKPRADGPVILAKPPGAPVIISPEPGSSPSQ
jgi:hypothetical protein